MKFLVTNSFCGLCALLSGGDWGHVRAPAGLCSGIKGNAAHLGFPEPAAHFGDLGFAEPTAHSSAARNGPQGCCHGISVSKLHL